MRRLLTLDLYSVAVKVHLYTIDDGGGADWEAFRRHYAGVVERLVVVDAAAGPRGDRRGEVAGARQGTKGHLEVWNEAWKESRGQASHVLLCEANEILWHRDLGALLEAMCLAGGTLLMPTGYEVAKVSASPQAAPGDGISLAKTSLRRAYRADRCCLFDPKAIEELNWESDRQVCRPRGRVRWFRRPGVSLYRLMDGDLRAAETPPPLEGWTLPPLSSPTAASVSPAAIPLVSPEALEHHSKAGLAALRQQRFEEARGRFEQVLAFAPVDAIALGNVASLLRRAGQLEDAEWALRQAFAAAPDQAELAFNLGNLLAAKGDLERAVVAYAAAVRAEDALTVAHLRLGLLLARLGKRDEARPFLETAFRRDSRAAIEAGAAGLLGEAVFASGKLREAEQVYRQWLAFDARSAEAHNGLGVVLQAGGRHAEARRLFEQSVALDPQQAAALNNLGNLLVQEGLPREALSYLRRAVALEPGDGVAKGNLAHALLKVGEAGEALEIAERQIASAPGEATGHLMRGFALVQRAQIDEALEAFARAQTRDPAAPQAVGNALFSSLYRDPARGAEILRLHREWAARLPISGSRFTQWENDRSEPERRLRIGYLSCDLRRHPVAYFLEPILSHHDADAVEVFAYSTSPVVDLVTERLRRDCPHWRAVASWSDEAIAAKIREDRIDILVDLSGHTAGNRATLLARKPAPVQALYIGYPCTSGLEAVDYLICDDGVAPPGSEAFYSETLMRQPGTFWCFRPHPEVAPSGRLPSRERGHLTFGSFNHTPKLSPRTVRMWAAVLRAVPGSRLRLKALALGDAETREHFLRQFGAEGVGQERLEIEAPTPGIEAFLRRYDEVDIALDPTPYNGGTTTCEALSMGVPVITLPGETFFSRMSLSFLRQLGVDECVAGDEAGYVRQAVELAADEDRRLALRHALRERLLESSVCDGLGATRELEASYREMWRRYCAGRGG